ncbi:hypothetical protein CCACVL1_19014 [Corchorus capsularis]|uniref:Uncharacterized protein n=1 Tax=Corchorus capsularis TaxID=210143 RepID=A0A1R3HJ70_COCAP|nr:hypothetical protein CCACVL1_19014 [Corchorus capsularis]
MTHPSLPRGTRRTTEGVEYELDSMARGL